MNFSNRHWFDLCKEQNPAHSRMSPLSNKKTPLAFLGEHLLCTLHEALGQLPLQSKCPSINIKFKLQSLNSEVLPSYFLEKLIVRQDSDLHFKQFSKLASAVLRHLSVQTRQL